MITFKINPNLSNLLINGRIKLKNQVWPKSNQLKERLSETGIRNYADLLPLNSFYILDFYSFFFLAIKSRICLGFKIEG